MIGLTNNKLFAKLGTLRIDDRLSFLLQLIVPFLEIGERVPSAILIISMSEHGV